MTRLHRLYDEQGQSPWLDNLTRPYLRDGTLAASASYFCAPAWAPALQTSRGATSARSAGRIPIRYWRTVFLE